MALEHVGDRKGKVERIGDRKVLRRSNSAFLLEREGCDFVVMSTKGTGGTYFLYPTKEIDREDALREATAEFKRR